MAGTHEAFDISDMPDLIRIVEAMRSSRQPQVLRRDDEDVALLVPLPARGKGHRVTAADHDAVLAAAGSWKDLIDAEELKEQLAAERGSHRPAASL